MKWKVLIPVILMLLVIGGYWVLPVVRQAQAGGGNSITRQTQIPPWVEKITLVAAGDILMHNTQIWSGRQADGSYAFDFFEPM